jgi:predicted DNA-binding transcriptional regulator AlpA
MHGKTSADTPTHGNVSMSPNRLYNSRETRELLGGISESTFRKLTASGELPARKIGAFVYVEQSAIDAYIGGLPYVVDTETPTQAHHAA